MISTTPLSPGPSLAVPPASDPLEPSLAIPPAPEPPEPPLRDLPALEPPERVLIFE